MKGISAIIATILMLMITIALAGTAYMYITGVFTSKIRTLDLIDAYCVGTTGTVIIRNDGPDTIRAAEQTLVSVDETCTEPISLSDIASGATATYSFTACGTNKTHKYRLIGPTNAASIQFRCA